MSEWTVAEIPDQTGKRALITGANSGIGYHTALELARKGAHVLLASRDRARGEAALARLRAVVAQASVELVVLDLASLAGVREFAAKLVAEGLPLDLLINNAGLIGPVQRALTADGFELHFGTNVLGPFVLTALLLPLLRKATGVPRVVTVASVAHKRAKLDFDDPMAERGYKPMKSYSQSKLADLMLAFELDRRLRAEGSPIRSVAAHPGVASTNIFINGNYNPVEKAMRKASGSVIARLLNTDAEGALPTLYAATAPEAVGGGYYGPQGFQEMRGGDVGVAKVAPQARDETAAGRLWGICEELSGVKCL
jgi:NAD(P)-dependent dehydrogenase (short-subunit alcohol dehydrogenase family)